MVMMMVMMWDKHKQYAGFVVGISACREFPWGSPGLY
jgi:hypothetical protein